MTNKAKRIILLFLPPFLYLLLAILLTYPLITKFFISIPGFGGDAYIFLYNQWWFKHALANNLNFFHSPMLLYPFGVDLPLSTMTIFNSLIISFFNLFLPSIAAFNLFIIFSLVAAAEGMYLLLKYLIKNKVAAFLGGLLFSFHPYIFYEIWEGHFNYFTVYFIPFFVYFLIKATQEQNKRYINATLAALFLAISFYTDLYYAYGLVFVFIIYCLWFLYHKKRKVFKDIKIFLFIASLFILMVLPLGIQLLRASKSGAYVSATNEQISLYSPDVRSLLVPSFLNTFFGNSIFPYYQDLDIHGGVIFIGYTLLILMIFGSYVIYKKREEPSFGFWKPLSIFFLFLSLGPILFIGSLETIVGKQITIPLPYQLLYFLPFFKSILVPPRFIIFFIFSLVIPAAYGFKFILDNIKKSFYKISFTIVVMALILFEYSSAPISLSETKIPEFYKKIAVDKVNYAILELPFALSTSFYTLGDINSSSRLQYFQTIHDKPILGGYISRVPNYIFNYYKGLAGLKYAISPDKLENIEINSAEIDLVRKTFFDLKIGYIIIHPEYYVSLKYNRHKELAATLAYFDKIFGKHSDVNNMFIYDLKDQK
jgi:hypothetical protein